jgi:hypothetical protein
MSWIGSPLSASRSACQVLRGAETVHQNQFMASRETTRPPQELPLRPQDEVECRRCGVHCDKVVYPAACVERSCPFLYAFEEVGRTYVGCMQKVYSVEIDLELLREAEARSPGFGAVKASRKPLPMCHAEVESTYLSRSDDLGCVNPEFHELPVGEPSFRVFAQVRGSA